MLLAIPGVDIKVIVQNDSSNDHLKKGDMVLQTSIGLDGVFWVVLFMMILSTMLKLPRDII